MAAVLPYVALSWDQVTEGGGYTFLRYHVYRDRASNPEPFAVIDAIGTTTHFDYLAIPGEHTYEVTWVADFSGAEIESDGDTAVADLDFVGAWLHEVEDTDQNVALRATTLRIRRAQAQEYRLARGNRRPTLFAGAYFARDLDLQLIPEAVREPETWEALDALALRQITDAALLCLRLGWRDDARYFVQIAGDLDESLERALSRGRLRFQEVTYEETS